MPSLAVMKVLMRELMTSQRVQRTPEPDLVMDDPEKVADYTAAGRENGVMAPVYLFHSAQISRVIRSGDTVLDLACGPANQLVQVARLNPDCQFIGVDLSEEMLDKAEGLIAEQGIRNIELRKGSIDDLSAFANHSMDAVMSTMALHHLPHTGVLQDTCKEAARVLKPGGGVYMADFGRLKSAESIDYFAHQYDHRQPPLFTLDYFYSLNAAFSLDDLKAAAAVFGGDVRVLSTFLVPFMVVIMSQPRRDLPPAVQAGLQQLKDALPDYHQVDLADMRTFFRLGGVASPMLA